MRNRNSWRLAVMMIFVSSSCSAQVANCALSVGAQGVLAPNTNGTTLSSTNSGGSAGTVSAVTTGPIFRVYATAPLSFTSAPATGGDNVGFSTMYSGSGATSISPTPGTTQTALNTGTTNLNINLAASKSVGVFAGGVYSAMVVVTCE